MKRRHYRKIKSKYNIKLFSLLEIKRFLFRNIQSFFQIKILISTILLIILFLMILRHFFIYGEGLTLNILLQIFGGFIATLFGVYISLYITNKEESKKKQEASLEKLINALMLISDDISLKKHNFEIIKKVLDKNQPNSYLIRDDFDFTQSIIKSINNQLFYSIVASGDFLEISKDNKLMYNIQLAYSNTTQCITKLISTWEYFDERFKSEWDKAPRKEGRKSLEQSKEYLKKKLELIDKLVLQYTIALANIEDFLKDYGITSYIPETEQEVFKLLKDGE